MDNLISGGKDKPEFNFEKFEYKGEITLPDKEFVDAVFTWIGYENLKDKEKRTKEKFSEQVKSLADLIK